MKKTVVISLGGSLIVPEKINPKWLDKFKETMLKLKSYKFAIVCGGGSVARDYITILKKEKKSKKDQSLAGIAVTRMNAKIMMEIFGNSTNKTVPKDMKQVKEMLEKKDIVFCGALRYAPNQTSDSTAVKLAEYLKTDFINITNVSGLYTQNPKNRKAKLIKKISWKDFEKKALKLKYKPGQHFVLDQKASKLIRENKITTFIIGNNLTNLKKLLNEKPFLGTTITG